MYKNKLREMDQVQLRELIRTARGEMNCDSYLQGGTVINVYSGEYIKTNVAIVGRRIAYVGASDRMVGAGTKIIPADNLYLCPGYIEPHAHPFQTYNPVTLAEKVMTLGTTTIIGDNLFFFMSMEVEDLLELWKDLFKLPVKLLWSVRLDPQTQSAKRAARFAPEQIAALLSTPLARQVGELTDWPSLVAGNEQMLENMLLAFKLGKRVEGHAPGASVQTLNTLAAAGISDCHESITGEEALNRLRLGMYATLRHSSLRPDLPTILKGLMDLNIDLRRCMITTDGITPPTMNQGFTDYILRLAIAAGVPAIEAYRMATLTPATYYGLDHELGGIAPGRLADILFLEDPLNPTPVKVMAEGEFVAAAGQPLVKLPEPNWPRFGIQALHAQLPAIKAENLVPLAVTGKYPVMSLVNPVITRRRDCELPVKDGLINISEEEGLIYAALLNKEGNWVCNGIIEGFARNLQGMACSNTITGDIILLGRLPREMLRAAQRMFELGGGVVITEDNSVIYELPLPLSGMMSDRPVDELIVRCSQLYQLLAERGHPHYDLLYTILFLSATHLPELRLSPGGILSVKDKQLIIPVREL